MLASRTPTALQGAAQFVEGSSGIVTVETRGYNQDGAEVLYFRRKVMVPKRGTVDEQPGRPEPRAKAE